VRPDHQIIGATSISVRVADADRGSQRASPSNSGLVLVFDQSRRLRCARSGWPILNLMVAPGFGPVGFGIAMVVVGGVLVGNGHNLAGGLLDLFGVISIWAGVRTYRGQ
jgi:hypothetical protein